MAIVVLEPGAARPLALGALLAVLVAAVPTLIQVVDLGPREATVLEAEAQGDGRLDRHAATLDQLRRLARRRDELREAARALRSP